MTTESPVKQEAVKPPKKNVFALLLGVLLRPKATFGYLKDNHKKAWWLPAILILLLTVAPLWAASSPSPAAQMVPPDKMEMLSSVDPLMLEGIPSQIDTPSSDAPSTASGGLNFLKLGGTVLGTFIAWLLWGGGLYLASVFLGRSSSFGQMFRLAVWTWLPYGLRGLVQTVYVLVTGEAIVNAGFSGFVIDKGVTSVISPGPGQLALASILSRVDVFMVWHVLLASVALMAFTSLTRRKALTATLAIWIVFALVGIVPAIFGGMVGGIGGSTGGGPYG
ncbi:MAG: YIP1 family protein [Anaerolineae bacterium]|nr:YIP1 family protein [Anaerolineae bacterium]